MKNYLSCAETAKMIRSVLKESFPGVKFSVVSSTYSMGASITIKYNDGPNADAVKAAVGIFEGSYFDGMQDYKGQRYAAIDGQEMSFGADYVFVNRYVSDAAMAQAIDALYEKFAGNFRNDPLPKATVEDYNQGRLFGRDIPGMGNGLANEFVRQIGIVIQDTNAGFAVQPSATLARITSLGDDGYGQGCVGRLAA
jgi:hypothetical protein